MSGYNGKRTNLFRVVGAIRWNRTFPMLYGKTYAAVANYRPCHFPAVWAFWREKFVDGEWRRVTA